jgi:alkylated DNA repair protein alkB homolog 8
MVNFFPCGVSIADRRRAFLVELLRVLRPGGCGLVTVWATRQSDTQMKKVRSWVPCDTQAGSLLDDPEDPYTMAGGKGWSCLVPWRVPLHRAEATGLRGGDRGDRPGFVTYMRYYHLFDRGELREIAETVPGMTEIKEEYDQDNWVLTFTKKKV